MGRTRGIFDPLVLSDSYIIKIVCINIEADADGIY